MYAVGRLGSYITRGVYTVSGPFHPFGGAVDIVVVEQQDGSYKSSPWYVRFGKFQGVLKGNEKVIDISVNDVEADFHMYLDPRGEAYFLREVEPGEVDTGVSPPSSSGEEMGSKKGSNRTMPVKSMSLNYGLDQCDAVTRIDASNAKSLSRTNSRRSRILGFVLGRKSMKADSTISKQEDDPDVVRADSLERAEIAADLLDLNWSTNKRRGEGHVRKTYNSASDILDAEVSKGWQINDGQVQVESLLNEQHFANKMEDSMINDTGLESKSEFGTELLKKIEEISVASASHENNADISATTSGKDIDDDGGCDEKNGDFTETCASKEEIVEGSNEPDREGDIMETCTSKEESVEGTIQPDMETSCLPDEKHGEHSVLAETVYDTPDMNSEVNPQIETSINYNTVAESYSELVSVGPVKVSGEVESCSSLAVSNFPTLACKVEYAKNSGTIDEVGETQPPSEEVGESDTLACDFVSPEKTPDKVEEEQFFFSDLDDVEHNEVENSESKSIWKETRRSSSTKSTHAGIESSGSSNYESDSSPSGFDQEVLRADIAEFSGNLRKLSSQVDIPRSCQVIGQEVERHAKSLPVMWSQSDEFHLHNSSNNSLDSKSKSSKWELLRKNVSRIKKSDVRKEFAKSSPTDIPTSNDLKDITHGHSAGDPSNVVDGTGGSWTIWPFRSRSRKSPSMDSKNDSDADCGLEVDGGKEVSSIQEDKMKLRALTPTSKQLASLNLKEGRNTVTFTFSTSVLGPQQVDARIYLWRWDTRIVISDVDGTITKSDVLGQFMPLVGRDWSQTGVTHLFSAIKENGYQMLFLSARAISQAYITRQFLFNLKQDGKALPDGPVVISPDGLFPSLFREVIRRAPHEFKIACLEDIKALFPPDRNPFYAGFGNRDTDEFSYVKVGIPKGKIFIINPKGEVVVNRCINSKSYTSLHALVNGMFPPITLHEEEDYNSWNFWKLPPATLDN